MPRTPPAPLSRGRGGHRLAAAAGGLTILAAVAGPLQASPLDDPHIGGIGFSGPATGDLGAIYWNPAAVGLVPDNELLFAGSARLSGLSLRRSPIDPATGLPGGARTFPEVHGRRDLHPVQWPPGPGAFLAVAASLGTRITLGLGAFSPFAQQVEWKDVNGQEPTRYHATRMDLRHWALVPALAIRLGGGIRVGVAPGFLFSTGRLTFDEDTALGASGATCDGAPCGAENPQAAARYEASSGLDPFDSSLSFTLAGGIHIERPGWALGLAYISRPLGTPGGGVTIDARHTSVQPPPRAGTPGLCPPESTSSCFFGQVQYRLPDTITAGFTYHATARLDLGVVLRWMNLSQHETIALRVVGPASGGLRAQGLPERIVLYRGFRDTLDTRVRAIMRVGDRALLSAGLRLETSAVAAERVSPAAVDALKVEPALAFKVRLWGMVDVAAGYAFTFVPTVETGTSAFDPTAVQACQEAGGDLRNAACQARREGRARPTAAGTYGGSVHNLSVSIGARL